MEAPAIRVDGLGKRYRLVRGRERAPYRTLRDSIMDFVAAPFGGAGTVEEFWALDDVSFEVKPGVVVGIIGRNGAGKSTLLKILSRITKPTTGRAEINGRVGSLLEVGTGFHPELTGRENVYLNGSILGMSRAEITKKFDEIVAFAEVEKFLDTPVKRYSSGMYVRLAFAVAAHLEPEILIVDEVLAVGDAQFQNKCLGKMRDVSKGGRTVLFVSHNMAAVRLLCSHGVVLEKGRVAWVGEASSAVDHYFATNNSLKGEATWDPKSAPQGNGVVLTRVWITDVTGASSGTIDFREPFCANIEYSTLVALRGVRIGIEVRYSDGTVVFGTSDYGPETDTTKPPGRYVSRCRVPGNTLNSGTYSITVGSDLPSGELSFYEEGCVQIVVADGEGHGASYQRPPGVARPAVLWERLT